MSMQQAAADYARVEQAIDWLRQQTGPEPDTGALALAMGISPSQCARLFRRWAGISPRRFIAVLGAARAGALLAGGASVLDTTLTVGLSSPGRLHDRLVTLNACSPGEAASAGAGLTLRHGLADSPFGRVFVAWTGRGLCHLSFVELEAEADPAPRLARQWHRARLVHDPAGSAGQVAAIFAGTRPANRPLSLLVSGTRFQVQVWRALLRIEPGQLTSYAGLAAASGQPGAARAIGNAMAANPLAFVIPCHRVLRADGGIGGYRWGVSRKLAMLACESSPPG